MILILGEQGKCVLTPTSIEVISKALLALVKQAIKAGDTIVSASANAYLFLFVCC
jgi:hypothetical protein